jgi:hypothetical protein
MTVLVVAPRCPWPPYSGDRLRAALWIEALAGRTDVVLITSHCDCGPNPFGVTIIHARRSLGGVPSAARTAIRRVLPFHTLLAATSDWQGAFAAVGDAQISTAIVVLSRTDPWVYRHIRAGRKILDVIDSAAGSMNERSRSSRNPVARAFWKMENRRAAHLERDAVSRYDQTIVIAESERAAFGPSSLVLPMGVVVSELPMPSERRFDFGFFGRLSYFANREALAVLIEQIWPEIRRLMPQATLFIGGADASPSLRRISGSRGITVVSPVADRERALRDVRIALLPLLAGTGESMKTLEFAEAASAVIGTSHVFRSLPALAEAAIVEDEIARFAARAIALHSDERRRAESGHRLRAIVLRDASRQQTLERMAAIALETQRPA